MLHRSNICHVFARAFHTTKGDHHTKQDFEPILGLFKDFIYSNIKGYVPNASLVRFEFSEASSKTFDKTNGNFGSMWYSGHEMFSHITTLFARPDISIRQVILAVHKFPNTNDDGSRCRVVRKSFIFFISTIQRQCNFGCPCAMENLWKKIWFAESKRRER